MHLGGVPLLEEAFAAEARRAKHRAQLPGRDRPVPVCPTMSSEEERSAIELRDKEPPAVEKPKHRTMSNPSSKARNDKSSILMPESLPVVPAKAIKSKTQIPEDISSWVSKRGGHGEDNSMTPDPPLLAPSLPLRLATL